MNRGAGSRIWALVGIMVVAHLFLHVGLAFGREAPDLLTVALLIAAREIGLFRAGALGLGFGLIEDALSVVAFGANAVAMTIVGIGGAVTRDLFVGDSRVFVISYFWLGKWVRDALHWASVGEGVRQPFVDAVLVAGAIGGGYAALVGFAALSVAGLAREA